MSIPGVPSGRLRDDLKLLRTAAGAELSDFSLILPLPAQPSDKDHVSSHLNVRAELGETTGKERVEGEVKAVIVFPVHQALLACRSSFFGALVASPMRDRRNMLLNHHPTHSPVAVRALLDYIYHEECHFPSDSVQQQVEVCFDLWKAQGYFGLSGNLLQRVCQKTLAKNINPENFLVLLNHSKALDDCRKFMARSFVSYYTLPGVLEQVHDLDL